MFFNSKNTFIVTILTIFISLLTNVRKYNPILFVIIAFGLLGTVLFHNFFMIIKVLHNKTRIDRVIFSLFSLILTYSFVYMALQNYDNNSFVNVLDNNKSDNDKDESIIEGFKEFLNSMYFTVVTFATVGYGDIVPKSLITKFLVITQILLSLFLFTIYLQKL
jgi:voltage-gated potassium channel Kch